MKKFLWFIPVLLFMTGCWNYHELNELAITTGIALDKQEDEFLMTILISNSKGSGSKNQQSEPSTAVYHGKGKTLYEAIKDTAASVSKQIYLGHIDILILSEDIIKEDTSEVIDFLFRYPQTRNEFQLVIAKDCRAGDILKITTPLESFPSQNVAQNLKITSKLQGFTYIVSFNDFVKLLLEDGVSPVLPSVEIMGDVEEGNKDENIEQSEPSTYLKLGNLGLFQQDRFVTWANHEESIGINILNNKITILGIDSECENGHTVTEISEMKAEIEVEPKENKFKIKVKANGSIQELSCSIDLENEGNIKEIKEKNAEKVKYYIQQAITLAQKNKADVFGFGNLIYKKDASYWREIKENWEIDLFSSIQVEYDIDINLEAKGKITNYIEVNK